MPPILDENDGSTKDVTTKDVATEEAPQETGVACTVAPDSGCNTLVNCGEQTNIVQVASNAPDAQGGTVLDGLYVMTSYTDFTGPGGQSGTTNAWFRETMSFTTEAIDSGSPTGDASTVLQQMAWGEISNTTTAPTNATATGTAYFESGFLSYIDITCPTNAVPFPATYTATPTTLTLVTGNIQIIFTKM